jgi:ABC-2 type transport system ATP-binding protein/lipopolysaccharide transport system ATP-binding protein
VKILAEIVIKVENVGMKFTLNQEKVDNLKEYFIKFLKRQLKYTNFWAVKNVSFEVENGDKLGIIGLNGAGKSILLKMISGVIKPTEGTIQIKGTIVPLLELGSGFDPEYTGKENIYLKGALLGYSKKYLDEKYDEIVEFSELEDFINVPLKNYSTGMNARLAFSIATAINPQIMILDEVLSVGDAKFREKSLERMRSLLEEDVTVLFVSHTIQQVKELCNKAIWLENGRVIMQGSAEEVCNKYDESVMMKEKIFISQSDPAKNDIKVPIDKIITLTFNETIKEGTNWIELLSNNRDNIPLKKVIDKKTLIINHPLLTKGTRYTLHLHTGCITDLEGNKLNTYSTSFTTEAE